MTEDAGIRAINCQLLTINYSLFIIDMENMIFKSKEFGEIRTVTDEKGEPWFCLLDVCMILGLTPKGVKQRLNDEVISNYPVIDQRGRKQPLTLFVNEDGLYDVILESRKPEARAFRRWVTG